MNYPKFWILSQYRVNRAEYFIVHTNHMYPMEEVVLHVNTICEQTEIPFSTYLFGKHHQLALG